LEFAKDIGIPVFLQECRKIVSVTEIAVFYNNKLDSPAELERILNDIA
jgi:hypothetical protein